MSQTVKTRNQRRHTVGLVTSDKMDKTIKVTIKRQVKHPLYEKRINRRTVYTAHDEKNEARTGDMVEIAETRKLSRTKCWRLVRILQRAEGQAKAPAGAAAVQSPSPGEPEAAAGIPAPDMSGQ